MTTMRRVLPLLCVIAFCVPARADVYDTLAKKLIKGVAGLDKAKAAVLPFAYADGRSSPGGRIVADGLATAIAEQSRAALVERDQLDKMLEEMKLGVTGAISSGTAVQAGKLVGAKYLVVGTLDEVSEERVEVHARLIETESGVVRAAAKGEVRRTWRDGDVPVNSPPPIKVTEALVKLSDPEEPLVQAFGDRKVRIEYGNTEDRPLLRLIDVTDPRHTDADEIVLPFDAHENKFRDADWGTHRAKIHGRRYQIWSGVWKAGRGPTLHIAPLVGFWAESTVGAQEMIVDFMDLVGRWVKQVERRGQFLGTRDGLELVAYLEKLADKRLRVSLWEITPGTRSLAPYPRLHLELQGRRGAEVSSNVLSVATRHFRFRYDYDADRVKVEEL